MSAIEFKNITKVFQEGFIPKKFTALKNVSFKIKPGSCIAYLGPNGAGKTTSIKLMLNLIRPTSGHISILGNPASSKRTRSRIGYVSDHPYFYNYLRLDEYMQFAADLYGIPESEKSDRIDSVLKMVHLADFRSRQLKKFSRGMGQRLSFAQALLHDPLIIIMDEPLNGLDPFGRRDLREIILQLKGQNRTIFFSSHILEDAEIVADEVIFIDKGKILFQGIPDSMKTSGNKLYKLVLENNTNTLHQLPALPSGVSVMQKNNLIEISGMTLSVLSHVLQFAEKNTLNISELSELNMPLERIFMEFYERESHENH